MFFHSKTTERYSIMIDIMINIVLLVFLFLLTLEFLDRFNDDNIYRNKIRIITKYISFNLISFKNKYLIIIPIIVYILLRAILIYSNNTLYNNDLISWHVRFYYLSVDNKLLTPLPFINSLTVSLITYITLMFKFFIIMALLYFKKKILLRISKLFSYLFEVIEPVYTLLREGYYGGVQQHTSVVLIVMSSIIYYVIWVILSLKIRLNSLLNGIILFISIINNMLLWYSILLFIMFLLFGFRIIKNKKIILILSIFYLPVKLKMESYFKIGKYKFNTGLLLSCFILLCSTYLLNHILINNLFKHYNFAIL